MSAICQGNISQVKVPKQLKVNKKKGKNYDIKTNKTFLKIKMKTENVEKSNYFYTYTKNILKTNCGIAGGG